uniref:J domain-containing protein n=1 Tax=Acrobeloides nanus TaxID=290746 RepID=A0A914CCL6_9BILA
MLTGTISGSLGTDITGANRVVLLDACWNPSHDKQSCDRPHRYGQTKAVYIYRFIAQGTMEENIYNRQITKESISTRVVDKSPNKRHIFNDDINLYNFYPNEEEFEASSDIQNEEESKENTMDMSCDKLLTEIIKENRKLIVEWSRHDRLFDEDPSENLTPEQEQYAEMKFKEEDRFFGHADDEEDSSSSEGNNPEMGNHFTKDYYSVLGLPINASDKDIKRAYHELALKYHPDKNRGNPAATSKYQEIKEAYEKLTTKESNC